MVIRVKNRSISDSLMYFSIIVLIIIVGLPISQALLGSVRQPIQIIAVAIFLIGSFSNGKKIKNNVALVILSLFFIVYFFGTWAGHNMNFTQYAFNVLSLLIFATYGAYLLDINKDYEYLKLLYKVIVIIVVITAITTTYGLIQYPLAVRDLGRTAGYLTASVRQGYMLQNIGTWSHLYGITFISPSFFLVFKKKRNTRYLIYWIICEVMILTSQVTYAVLLSILLNYFIIADFSKGGKSALKNVLLIIVACAAVINLKNILNWFITLLNNANYITLSSKLNDLYILLFYRQSIGDASARFDLYGDSLNAFLSYPIGGLFLAGREGFNVLGFHSDLFDIMGYFGLLGLLVLVIFSILYLRKLQFRVVDKRSYYIMFLFYALIFTLNAMLFSPMVAIGVFVMPTLVTEFAKAKETKGNVIL